MKTIIVTGTPATGKTTLAKLLAKKLRYKYIDVKKLIKEKNLKGKYKKKLDTYEIDIKKLNKELIKIIKENDKIIIDSHLSHYLPKRYVNLCIVCKCNIKELKKRLEKRKYTKQKIRENLDSEIFDICLIESKENKYKIIEINTTNIKPQTLIRKIIYQTFSAD